MEDNLIKYTVIKGFYESKSKIDIYLPKTLYLVYNDGDIGDGCHIGHNHYIGFTKYSEKLLETLKDKNRDALIHKFDDLILIQIDNILDENHVLPIYTYIDMMQEFNLNNYFIVYKKPTLYRLKPSADLFNPEWEQIQSEHIYQILRIKEVFGPYHLIGFKVCIEPNVPSDSTNPYYSMEEVVIDNLFKWFITYSNKYIISVHKDYWEEYNKLINIILSKK